jgi:O-acetyl-ADP-ribose deacetylase (regulator of RNase III)
MITEIRGDLFKTEAEVIIHGCNCQGVMGAGVAKIIKEKYPEAYKLYRNEYNKNGLKLGNIQCVWDNSKLIINAMTQEFCGNDKNIVYVDYNAVRECMNKIYVQNASYSVAMPKIGCGLANGDWNIVKQIIKEELPDMNVLVYYL